MPHPRGHCDTENNNRLPTATRFEQRRNDTRTGQRVQQKNRYLPIFVARQVFHRLAPLNPRPGSSGCVCSPVGRCLWPFRCSDLSIAAFLYRNLLGTQRPTGNNKMQPPAIENDPHKRRLLALGPGTIAQKPSLVTPISRRWGELVTVMNRRSLVGHFQANPASRLRFVVCQDRVACSLFSLPLNIR